MSSGGEGAVMGTEALYLGGYSAVSNRRWGDVSDLYSRTYSYIGT